MDGVVISHVCAHLDAAKVLRSIDRVLLMNYFPGSFAFGSMRVDVFWYSGFLGMDRMKVTESPRDSVIPDAK